MYKQYIILADEKHSAPENGGKWVIQKRWFFTKYSLIFLSTWVFHQIKIQNILKIDGKGLLR